MAFLVLLRGFAALHENNRLGFLGADIHAETQRRKEGQEWGSEKPIAFSVPDSLK
jgi:hypothetical protein